MFNTLLLESSLLLESPKNWSKVIRLAGDASRALHIQYFITGIVLIRGTTQELVEAAQVGERHGNPGRRGRFGDRCRAVARRRLDRGQRVRPLDDRFSAGQVLEPAGFDGPAYSSQGVLTQELQDPHEPPVAGQGAMQCFQLGAELGEAGRKLPVPVHRCVVQRPGLRLSVAR